MADDLRIIIRLLFLINFVVYGNRERMTNFCVITQSIN